MILVLSPAKTLDFNPPSTSIDYSQPDFLEEAAALVQQLRALPPHGLSELMSISDKLGVLNFDRYQTWSPPFTPANAKQAVLAFKGDVYTGLEADTFSAGDLDFAQKHLRILSGLYGVLRPLDLIQPYRLEMGTGLKNPRGANLYQYWGESITTALHEALVASESEVLVNLASNEYFRAVKPARLRAELVVPVFKEWRGGQYRIISFSAKRARGKMAAFILRNRLQDPQAIKGFSEEGYAYEASLSSASQWVFTRGRE